jgi:TRAP-type mannitol/chloroaromatic compound transport system permease small subunit
MKAALAIADRLDAFIDRVGWLAAGLTLAMVLLISGNTLMRYFFNTSAVWAQELEWHLLAMVALWGIAYMQLRGDPVRVDMFYQHYSARTKLWIEWGVALFVMLPFAIFLCVLGWRFAAHSYALAEVSPDPGGLPMRWLVKSLVVSGYALLAIVALSTVIRTSLRLLKPESTGASHGV